MHRRFRYAQEYIYIYVHFKSFFSPSFLKKKKKALLASMQRVSTKEKKKRACYSYTQEAYRGRNSNDSQLPSIPPRFFEAPALQHRVANTEDGPHFRSSKKKKEHIYVLLPFFFLQLTSV